MRPWGRSSVALPMPAAPASDDRMNVTGSIRYPEAGTAGTPRRIRAEGLRGEGALRRSFHSPRAAAEGAHVDELGSASRGACRLFLEAGIEKIFKCDTRHLRIFKSSATATATQQQQTTDQTQHTRRQLRYGMYVDFTVECSKTSPSLRHVEQNVAVVRADIRNGNAARPIGNGSNLCVSQECESRTVLERSSAESRPRYRNSHGTIYLVILGRARSDMP
jgi:hypothetical protein